MNNNPELPNDTETYVAIKAPNAKLTYDTSKSTGFERYTISIDSDCLHPHDIKEGKLYENASPEDILEVNIKNLYGIFRQLYSNLHKSLKIEKAHNEQ